MSMNVSITDSLEEFVQAQVKSGMYASASEVVRSGLRLLREREISLHKHIDIAMEKLNDPNAEWIEMNDEFWNNLKADVVFEINNRNSKKNV
jgi:putative addiction module CopG family antidote